MPDVAYMYFFSNWFIALPAAMGQSNYFGFKTFKL